MSALEARVQRIDAHFRMYRQLLILMLAAGVILNGALFWYASAERPAQSLMEFTRAVPAGNTTLCPGDTLRYDIALHVSGPGVFDLDIATWRVTPPATVLFSTARRMVFSGPADYTLARAWTVPEFYSGPVDGSPERWAAGHYERRHAITTISRSTEPSIISIPFQIAQECD